MCWRWALGPAVKIEIYREAGANIVELANRLQERLFGTEEDQEDLERWREFREQRYTGSLLKKEENEEEKKEEEEKGKKEEQDSAVSEDGDERVPVRPRFIAAHLPQGMNLTILSDQSTFIESAIHDLYQTATLGGILAVLVLYLFLGRFSYTAVVALSIPFSVVATFAPMPTLTPNS